MSVEPEYFGALKRAFVDNDLNHISVDGWSGKFLLAAFQYGVDNKLLSQSEIGSDQYTEMIGRPTEGAISILRNGYENFNSRGDIMTSKMDKYILISRDDKADLMKAVIEALDVGYKLEGGVSSASYSLMVGHDTAGDKIFETFIEYVQAVSKLPSEWHGGPL